MKFSRLASKTLRVLFWVLLGIVLFVVATVCLLYTSAMQTRIKDALVEKINSKPGTSLNIDTFKLGFPLVVDISGLSFAVNGDTMINAGKAHADVALLPLLKGQVDVKKAVLQDAMYALGNADSLTQLRLSGGRIAVNSAKVKLSPLAIDLIDGELVNATVALISRPDTMPPTPPDTTSELTIKVRKVALDNFTYKMQLLPTIDSLGVNIGHGIMQDGLVDLKKQTVDLRSIVGSRLNASYIAGDSAQIAAAPIAPVYPDTIPSRPWTVSIDSIGFTDSEGLYTTRGYEPLPGLDFGYIQATGMEINVHNFYNQETTLRLPITLTGTERCGIQLKANGTFAMDSLAMYVDSMTVETPVTYLWANAMMGAGDMTTDPNLPLSLVALGNIGVPDIMLMFPDFAPYFKGFAKDTQIDLDLDVHGTPANLDISKAKLSANNIFRLGADGRLQNIFSNDGPDGNIDFTGNIYNVKNIVASILEPGSTITVPPMSLSGAASMKSGTINANLDALTLDGKLVFDGSLNGKSESYQLDIKTSDFPVNAFVPDLALTHLTMQGDAKGNGFDIFKPKTNLDAHLHVNRLVYDGVNYDDITLNASVHNGNADIKLESNADPLQFEVIADGNLNGNTLEWSYDITGDHVNLKEMGLSPTTALISTSMSGDAELSNDFKDIKASLNLENLDYESETYRYVISDVKTHFATADSLTSLSLINRDLTAQAMAPYSLDTLLTKFTDASLIFEKQFKDWQIGIDTLQKALPHFEITANAGSNNLINDILQSSKASIRHFALSASNDSTLSLNSSILGISTEILNVDTVGMYIFQDGDKMRLAANVNNQPGTLDNFAHVSLDCLFNSNKLAMRLTQQNINDETGFDIGAITAFSDTLINGRLFPLTPIIGYKKWTVNFDNYIKYYIPKHLVEANLKMKGDNSSLQLYSENKQVYEPDSTLTEVSDLFLKISDIHLSDWIKFNPFAPPINGTVSADLNLKWNGKDDINGSGDVTVDDLFYDRQRVGSFIANLDIATTLQGMIRAKADLSVDGERTMTIAGALNDSTATSPFNLDFSVIKFPLRVANPFLPANIAQLTGTLNGQMEISGDAERPILNGEISFDQAAIKAAITNTSYAISDVKIPVINNLVSFDNFSVKGTNDNPLYLNGTVDISSMVNPKINLKLDAKNMMLVNSNRAARGAEVYGKAWIDLQTTVKGDMEFLNVDADLSVLSGTNVTYVLTEAASQLTAPIESDMVKFVNFNDSLQVMEADSLVQNAMLLNINATLNIQSATTINVDLPTAARDKVQIQPQGQLNYLQSPISDGRLVGRINIDGGYARYTLPVVGAEKTFNFDEDSYIAFNGDMFNPVLNVHATDIVKANVTQEGQNSRLINFDIMLGITGTLSTMDVKFNLATTDDITIANELQSMTAEQRANQAMNLLLYNVYTGPGTKASANLSANPLFSFLESQINNWAANNIKGVDISFGIDQYNQTTNGSTQQTMSYSYQVSKSLFNDRFKIVIGGNYTTDANADENLSENLINDISFEYFLNKSQTMLLKLFRHTGYESILEGEITKTGVGFVYKRKLHRLDQMLPRFMRVKRHIQ